MPPESAPNTPSPTIPLEAVHIKAVCPDSDMLDPTTTFPSAEMPAASLLNAPPGKSPRPANDTANAGCSAIAAKKAGNNTTDERVLFLVSTFMFVFPQYSNERHDQAATARRRFAPIPSTPTRPVPNNHTAAGIGTGATVKL
ncbi:hypothetical protein sS8_2195 [Methylocaldum marinum]|uniref:Uncharacterized protein n=1 Tax=Methylocaldum marinum TaxID=1432792 RepID=A0A250KRD0_9GAMM|nr:hypothetical protein sS8_2195 [Methylocaldum marinum]